MAKVSAPFLSLNARGQVGKTLVAGSWKGVKYIRNLVIPKNPRTTDQVAQRNLFTIAVAGWTSSGLIGEMINGWNAYATALASPLSGFNYFVRNILTQLKANPANALTLQKTQLSTGGFSGHLINLGTGSIPTPLTGYMHAGDNPSALALEGTVAITEGTFIHTTAVPPKAFYQLRLEDGTMLSGIFVYPTTPEP